MILAHFVGFCGEGEAIALERCTADSVLIAFAGHERLADVMGDSRGGFVHGPGAVVGVVAVDGGGFIGRRGLEELFA